MKTVHFKSLLFLLLGASLIFVSCKNEDLTTTDADAADTAQDEAQVSSVNDEVVNSADDYLVTMENLGLSAVKGANEDGVDLQKASAIASAVQSDSVVITVDRPGLNDYPKKVCIDFGTKGVTLKRGYVVKGKLYIYISAKMNVAGSYRTYTFVDFFVNANSVKGSKTVTYKGLNTELKPYWRVVVKDTVTRENGTKIIAVSERTRTRINNNQTPLIAWDDTYSITGASSGVNAKGVAYTAKIDETKPLIRYADYRHFVQGAILITTEQKTVLLDYGDGTKDDKATITVNGITKEITLRK